MNFNTEKMAKSIDLPSKSYLTELKKQHPNIYGKMQLEYDTGFQKFFSDISLRCKQMLVKEIDVPKFVEICQKEFQKRNEYEKRIFNSRKEQKCLLSSDNESVVETVVKPMKLGKVKDLGWSDEDLVPPSGTFDTRLETLQRKYDSLLQDYNLLQFRYTQCKATLTMHMTINDVLRKENTFLTQRCVCQNIEELLMKRKRTDE